MAFKTNFLKSTAVLTGIAAMVAFGSGAAQAQSSVEDDAGSANTLVSAQVAPAAAGATASVVATAVGAAVAPPAPSIGGVAPTAGLGAPETNLAAYQASKELVAGNFFSTRALAGKSAGAKQPRLGAWVQAAYTTVDNDETGGQFDGDIYNVVAGLDFKPKFLKEKGVIGVAVSWESTDVSTTFNAGTFEGSGISAVPYIGIALGKHLAFDLALGYSWLDYDNSRTNGAVTGDFDGWRAFAAGNLGGNFYKKRLRISPKVGLLGLYEEQDSYTDSTGVAVGRTFIHMGRAMGGLELGYQAKNVEPFASARVNFDFDQNAPVTLTTGQVASDDELSATFAVGLNLNRGNVSGQIKGETTQFKNDITTYSISGRVRVNF